MEEVSDLQAQSGAPEASDAQPAAGESGARTAAAPPQPSGRSGLDNLIRGVVTAPAPASKPAAEETDGESTSQEAVKPSEGRQRQPNGQFAPKPDAAPVESQADPQGQPIPRRGAAAEIERLRQENEALKAQNDPATLRAQVLADIEAENARKAAEAYDEDYLGNEDRYRKLVATPDYELSAEDYQWREERKERRAKHSHVERHYQSAAERQLQVGMEDLSQKQNEFWKDVKGQMGRLASRKGVDQATYSKLGNFEQMGSHLYDAGARSRDDEVAGLEEDLREARAELERHASFNGSRGPGSGRSPVPAGRSSNGQPTGTSRLDAFIRGTAPLP